MKRRIAVLVVVVVGVSLLLARADAAASPITTSPITTSPVPADSARQALARAYLDALLTHDSSAVRFTPNATRVEAGLKTGFSGPQMTADLAGGLQYRIVQAIRDLTLVERGTTVVAQYLLDAGFGSTRLMTVAITERFEIPVDAIDRVEAQIRPVSIG